MGFPLSKGSVHDGILTCYWHYARFDLETGGTFDLWADDVRTFPVEGKERLVGADASHAWFAVYCPDAGWVDFDPTNNLLPAEDHITVAYGRDYSDVSPLCGIITGGGKHEVAVGVEVSAIS